MGRRIGWQAFGSAVITGVGRALPPEEVSSRQIEERLCTAGLALPQGMIERLSGVVTRRYAGPGCTSSDLAAQAALMALHQAGIEPGQVDRLLYASATHDLAEPATANLVQEKTGCHNAQVCDVKNACNSFLNALEIADALIRAGRARRVLIASGEMLSPVINFEINDLSDLERKFAALTLGDGGGACLLEGQAQAGRGLCGGSFYSDGSQWRLSTVLSGGTLLKNDFSRWYFECESQRLNALALQHLPGLIEQALAQAGWEPDEIDCVIPHQVSIQLVERLCERFAYPFQRCVMTLDRLGNLAAASIPVALSLALEEGRVGPGAKVLLVGAAAGFSAAVLPFIL